MLVWISLLLIATSGIGTSDAKSQRCSECEVAVNLLHHEWGENSTEDCTIETAIFICEEFKIEDSFVCDHIVGEFADEFVYVVGQVVVEPHQICGLIMADCGTFIDPLRVDWNITIPGNQPTPIVKNPIQPGNPVLKILHLTDIHLDTQYVIGQEADCNEPLCCRYPDNPQEVSLAVNITNPAGPWGTIASCDLPYWTFQSMLKFIRQKHTDIDYIVVSGDLVSHAVYEYTQDSHMAMVKNISDTIKQQLPDIPTYFAVGNHEGVPIDNFAPHYTPKKFHMDWLYDTMAESWNWIPSDQMKVMKYMGCYMVKLFPGLRLLSLNNPLGGDAVNFWLTINDTDPDGTMAWVIEQLLDAENAGDKVHVVSHIPGGDSEAREGYALNYYKVTNRFQNTISAQFFGHTHHDAFYMVYEDPNDATSRPTGVVYAAPSVTTFSEYNPAYRIYTVDGKHDKSTFEVIDYEEWFLNMTTANLDPNNEPVWEQLFASINQEYGLLGQTPTEYNKMLNRMKTDDNLFKKYRENRYRRNEFDGITPCDTKCKNHMLCESRQFHHDENLCADLKVTSYTPPAPKYRKKVNRSHFAERPKRSDGKCLI
ncbi:unnamed protein product [Auanema sp. JU1783]|nr:unnamed protein product [Auanema sp. JU1783]